MSALFLPFYINFVFYFCLICISFPVFFSPKPPVDVTVIIINILRILQIIIFIIIHGNNVNMTIFRKYFQRTDEKS